MADAISQSIDVDLQAPGVTDYTAKYRDTPRVVRNGRAEYLLPTVVHCESPEAAIASKEYMFPFVTVVECPEAKLLEAMGPTLVCTAITEKPELRRALLDATHIDRLNLGPVPDHPSQLAPAARGQHRRFSVPPARVAERRHVKILFVTAGAAGMYCGSCLRDNALAAELKARGHDVLLVPLYTPTLTDEPNVSEERVFFNGISVYLQQRAGFFRWAPRAVRQAARRALAHQGGGVWIDFDRSAIAGRADDLDAQGRGRLSAEGVREAPRLACPRVAAGRHSTAQRAPREPGASASTGAETARALHAAGRRPVP